MTTKKTYPYIRAHGRWCGSNAGYVASEVRMAQEDNAPEDAWSYKIVTSDNGHEEREWRRMGELRLSNPDHYKTLKVYAGEKVDG